MKEQWQELKETIIELRDNDGTSTQQEICKFLVNDMGVLEKQMVEQGQKSGHWILQPSNKEQGERDFIWWKCSECGHVIYSETEKDRREYHAFCGRCGARMDEPKESEESLIKCNS